METHFKKHPMLPIFMSVVRSVIKYHSMSLHIRIQNQKYQTCIDACNDCFEACEACATECVREQDVKVMT